MSITTNVGRKILRNVRDPRSVVEAGDIGLLSQSFPGRQSDHASIGHHAVVAGKGVTLVARLGHSSIDLARLRLQTSKH